MGLVMKQLAVVLLGSAILGSLPGCSSSVAAPVQNVPTQPHAAISLAPVTDVVSDNPIKIPEGRKSFSSTNVKPVIASTKNQNVNVNESDADLSPETAPEQDRKQDKQDKTNRKNGMRQDGRQFDKKQDDKQRSDRLEKLQVVKKQADEPSKPVASPVPVSAEPVAPSTQVAPSTDSASTPATTSAPVPAVVPAVSAPTSSAVPASFSVTYGSSASASSRNFKKPSLPSGLPSWFTDNDKDGDGQLSMNEWPSDRFEEFSKYDRNGDGIITIEEAMKTVPKAVVAAPAATPSTTTTASATPATVAAPPKVVVAAPSSAPSATGTPMSDDEAKRSAERVFSFVDTNKDGFLDEKEIANTQSIKNVDWKKYDSNRDGKLDMNEAIALYKAEGANLRRGGMGGGPGGPGGGGWGNMSPEDRAKMMFDNMDKNKTGKITKEQFPGFWRDRFAEFDTNKDGFVDLEEFKAASAKMMQGGGRGGPGGGGPGGGGRGGQGGGDNGGRGGRGGDSGGRGARGGFGGGNG